MKSNMGFKLVLSIIFLLVFFSGCIHAPGPENGTLILSSSPSGAEVYLDNQYRSSTPSTITDVAPGQHIIEFRFPGYQSWSSVITVSGGESNYFAALSPVAQITGPILVATLTPFTTVTVTVSRDPMIIGESNTFSGTATGTNTILLTVYGPGKYTDGISLVRQNVNSKGEWISTWNPGPSLLPGRYTIEAEDAWKNTSVRKEFTVIGGGVISASASTRAASRGQTVTFSGQCTTGASNVRPVLYGPGQLASGVQLPMVPVNADKMWSFHYTIDATMPTGQYTMYVSDSPQTTSSTVQFTVGYAS